MKIGLKTKFQKVPQKPAKSRVFQTAENTNQRKVPKLSEKEPKLKSENAPKTPENQSNLRIPKQVETFLKPNLKSGGKMGNRKSENSGEVRFTALFDKSQNLENKKVRSLVLF